MGNTNEIILYQPDEAVRLEVMLGDDTVWLTLDQLAALFDRNKSTISRHIKNIYAESELFVQATVAKFATVQVEGDRLVERQMEYYNLDVIISVGYRVKSQRGTQFRIWATSVLRDYLLKGYAVNQRMDGLESRMVRVEEKVDFFVRTALPPVEGIFYEGQIFDAYQFVSKLVKSAKKRIVLIDNYVDETVLALLAKRRKAASALICTSKISKTLQTDVDKHNVQYPPIAVCRVSGIHDRFLIVDENVYHIGASIKDLGKKLFAFSKLSIPAKDILNRIAAAEEWKEGAAHGQYE
ncbi:MAG: virulence RhuM family protein [Clostridiales Family XIII bacterium]|jgi:hypothetical protein|nr:virulence RhuM family protein [Clostridiales Family XIII bacterium]